MKQKKFQKVNNFKLFMVQEIHFFFDSAEYLWIFNKFNLIRISVRTYNEY